MKIARFALPACLCFGFIVGFAAEAYADTYRTNWYVSDGTVNPCSGTEGGACGFTNTNTGLTGTCYFSSSGATVSCYGAGLSVAACTAAGGTQHTAPGGSGQHCDLPAANSPC